MTMLSLGDVVRSPTKCDAFVALRNGWSNFVPGLWCWGWCICVVCGSLEKRANDDIDDNVDDDVDDNDDDDDDAYHANNAQQPTFYRD